MEITTTTGIAFALSSLGLAFCGFWFFRAFQKIGGLRSGSKVGVLLSGYFLGTAFQHGLLALGGLFFAGNPEAQYAVLTINNFVLGIMAAVAAYLFIYLFFPNYSPWPAATAAFLLGLFVTGLTIIAHPQPLVSASRSVDWNMPRWVELPLYYLLLLQIGAPFLIFTRNFFQAATRDVKVISLIVMAATFLGLVNVSVRFGGFLTSEILAGQIFDRILSIIGILLVAGFLVAPILKGWTSRQKS